MIHQGGPCQDAQLRGPAAIPPTVPPLREAALINRYCLDECKHCVVQLERKLVDCHAGCHGDHGARLLGAVITRAPEMNARCLIMIPTVISDLLIS